MKSLWKVLLPLVALGMLASCTPTPLPAAPETEATTSEATLQITGSIAGEQTFTAETLRALGTRETAYTNKDGETTTYTGVPFTTLLDAVGATANATTLIFTASDGYEAQAMLVDVTACDGCIVAFQDQGGFRVVLPDFPSNIQVRDLITIQVLSDAEAIPQAPETGDEAIPNDGPVTVTDAAGRTVSLERLPRRIVVVGRGPYMALHLLYTFPEGRSRLIGVESKNAAQSDFIIHVDPNFVDGVVSLAANPNPEQIAALEPDLVLMKSVVMEEMGDALAQVDIPVVYVGLETPEQFFQDVTNLGLLLGNPTRAEEVITFYQSRLDRVTSRVADVPESERPRVLLVDYSDRSAEVAVQVPALAWMQTFQVKAAGGIPVWVSEAQITDGWTVVNFEQIAAWNPDKIFVVMTYDHDMQAVIDNLKADVYWSKLTAVQNGELYAYPMDHFQWNTPEPRWILGYTWLATRIYPNLFADVDMQEEVYTFFNELYGLDRATVDKVIMPKVFLDVR
jgi:iron complex transport system substrate-binding protein